MDAPRIVVVGGGLAGLAAATALAVRGCRVTVLESRPRWGGRASSFADATTGELIDNCQHVSMGCCTNFNGFCDDLGLAGCFRREKELWFIGPDGRESRFSSQPLPAPLHLGGAFFGLKYLTFREKSKLAFGLRSLVRAPRDPAADARTTMAEWLRETRQPGAVVEKFWHVVLVSALSETLDQIAVPAARKVFADGFLAHRRGWEVLLPTVPLGELYGARLTDWLTNHAVDARLQAGVAAVQVEQGRATGVQLRGGESIPADHVVLAVPQSLVAALLPAPFSAAAEIRRLAEIETAPISSVHLWFDRPICARPHATLVGRLSQWVFNRSAIQGRPSERGEYYQVVISASREVAATASREVIAQVVAELRQVWPAARDAQLLHSRLVTEHKAALSMRPGLDELRLPQQSLIHNVQFAGDWTRTGWPSTMEGAVRSGYLAAENILTQLGRPAPVLKPDLPTSPLARALLGL